MDLNRALELEPNWSFALDNRGAALSALGRYEEAIADYTRSLEEWPDDPATLASRALAYARVGKGQEALADANRAVDEQDTEDLWDPGTMYDVACVYAQLDAEALAIDALSNALDLGFDDVDLLENDPDLDKLRKSPQFRALLREVKGGQNRFVSVAHKALADPGTGCRMAWASRAASSPSATWAMSGLNEGRSLAA